MRSIRLMSGVLTTVILACGGGGCLNPTYMHAVFFTCNPDTPKERMKAMVADSLKELPRISSVRKVSCGLRDASMDRPVNVADFDLGLIVHFDDRRGYEAYRRHPIHFEQTDRYGDMVAKMRVFDMEAE